MSKTTTSGSKKATKKKGPVAQVAEQLPCNEPVAVSTTVGASYTASIKIFGKIYSAQGESARDAVSKLDVGKIAKGASVLTVTNGVRTHEKILNRMLVTKLFTPSPMMREIALKQVASLFDF